MGVGDRPVYVIRVRPEPDCSDSESQRGLQLLLKRMLRSHGLRCLSVVAEKRLIGEERGNAPEGE